MNFTVPDDRRYLESHEWAQETDERVRIGITDFAQDELGDVVFVELPMEGDTFESGDAFGVIESIKAVSDVYVPVGGDVLAVNEELFDQPELVNEDPYGDGWMIELEASGALDETMDAQSYRDQIE